MDDDWGSPILGHLQMGTGRADIYSGFNFEEIETSCPDFKMVQMNFDENDWS